MKKVNSKKKKETASMINDHINVGEEHELLTVDILEPLEKANYE